MPIYKGRRKGTYRVTVFANGKQHEWIVEGTRADARRYEDTKRQEFRARPAANIRAEPRFVTLCVDHYRPYAEMHLGARTWRKVRRYQIENLGEHFGDVRVSDLAPLVDAYKRSCLDRGVLASTINHDLKTLRTILRWAYKRGLISFVPDFTLLPVAGKRRVHCWNMADVRRLYEVMAEKTPWLVPIFHFLLETGCRKGEAIEARWAWVDWERRMLRIPVTATWHPKDKDARDVPLGEALMVSLRSMERSDSGVIFPSRFGGRWAEFPDREFRRIVRDAGLKGGPHTTRHTYASHFLSARPDLMLLASVLGHSHTRVTELYAHLLPDHLERARDAVQLSPPSADWATRGKRSAS
jgi:integrase